MRGTLQICQRQVEVAVKHRLALFVLVQKFVRGNVELNSHALADFFRRMFEAICHDPKDGKKQRSRIRYQHGLGFRIVLPLSCYRARMKENLMTVKEVAEHLHLSPHTIYKWVEMGRIPVIRLGYCVRFRPSDIKKFEEQRLVPAMRTQRKSS